MTGFTKLFSSIVTSTIWQECPTTKVVWVTMLALADRDGIVEGSVPGLAHIAGVKPNECEDALGKFLAPDVYSRSKDHDGRRIKEIKGGWQLLNYDFYRSKLDKEDQAEKHAARQKRYRDRKLSKVTASDAELCPVTANADIAEAEAEAVKNTPPLPTSNHSATTDSDTTSNSFDVARAVVAELLSTDPKAFQQAQQQAAIYLAKGETRDEIRDGMLSSWAKYQASDEKAKFGLDRFLGTGEWRKWLPAKKHVHPADAEPGPLEKMRELRRRKNAGEL